MPCPSAADRRIGRPVLKGSLVFAALTALLFGLIAPASALASEPVSVSDGTRTLTVSVAENVDPAGQKVTVTGDGFDESKGIYVAFCVDTGPGKVPTPCLGGVDMEGTTGGSVWISSNPPPYGEGLALPYETGGSFAVSLNLAAVDEINGVDCRAVACVVTSRNDHTRSGDRSQDLRIPVTFAESGAAVPPASSSAPAKPTKTAAPTSSSAAAATSDAVTTPDAPPSGVISSGVAPTSGSASTETSAAGSVEGTDTAAATSAASESEVTPSTAGVDTVAAPESTSNTGWIIGVIAVVVVGLIIVLITRKRREQYP
ncbi:hypothetical protein D1871_21275 [Nakamurella silvestris]|nr:hypothetical protein D1871_21275 [Nakamurella silvestris]